MTLDLDELGRIASAATPGPWERRVDATGAVIRLEPAAERGKAVIGYVTTQTLGAIVKDGAAHDGGRAFRNAAHIAAFNPAVCAVLLARARDAERLEKFVRELTTAYMAPLSGTDAAYMIAEARILLSALNEGGPANG